MAGPRALSLAEARALLQLSRAVHTSADPVIRKRRMLERVCELVSASAALLVVAQRDGDSRHPHIVSSVRHGAPQPTEDDIFATCRVPQLRPARRGVAHEWVDAGTGLRRKGRRLHHCLARAMPARDAHVFACLSISRGGDAEPPFAGRDRALVHLVHAEMSWIYQSDLVLASTPALSLTPRQRQTLQYLLAGFGEKQIAARMHLSPNTIHHYIKALHKHFGVSTRSELLAMWVK